MKRNNFRTLRKEGEKELLFLFIFLQLVRISEPVLLKPEGDKR